MTVALDDVVADEPSEGASHKHIGGEVILAKNAGDGHAAGPGVEHDLSPARGVFFGEGRRGSEGNQRMG